MPKGVTYRQYSSVEKKDIKWLWYPYIPYGKITLLQGDPGDGKSTFMIHVAACISNGGAFPDGSSVREKGVVIYQCAEDSICDTIKPRLINAGADCNNIFFIIDQDMTLSLTDDRIEQTICKTRAKVLILDPIQAFIPSDGDMQSASSMRNIMRKLADIAERYECAVVLIGHMTKASGGKKLYRGLGSIDIAAIARSVLMISRDEKIPQIRYMFPVKSSLAPEGPAISFTLDANRGFQWIGKCVMNHDNISSQTQNYSKKERCGDYLRIILSAGELPSSDVLNRLEQLGIKERTVRSAAKDLGVKAFKSKNSWYWRLPDMPICEEIRA